MAQAEIIDWLAAQRTSGCNEFFTSTEIEEGLKHSNVSVSRVKRVIVKLFDMGFLEVEQEGFSKRKYRLKQKYVVRIAIKKIQ